MSDCGLLLVLVCVTGVIITPTLVHCQSLRWPPTGANNKKYYTETTYKTNWHAAYVACVKNNSRLATIESAEENSRVLELIANSRVKGHSYWLGASELAEEGRWSWLLTGQPVTGYYYWHDGEPNQQLNNEHCMNMYPLDGVYKWNDGTCSVPSYFICEYYESHSILDDCDWKIG